MIINTVLSLVYVSSAAPKQQLSQFDKGGVAESTVIRETVKKAKAKTRLKCAIEVCDGLYVHLTEREGRRGPAQL